MMERRTNKASKHGKKTSKRRKGRKIGCFAMICLGAAAAFFGWYLWAQTVSKPFGKLTLTDGESFHPQVGEPPYRIVVDAGHGGADPGASGVVEERKMTADTATALFEWLEKDANYVPLSTRDSYETPAKPSERAARANEQAPDILISIHGNSAPEGSIAEGFECYPVVPGRAWHQESFYFAKLLAKGMQNAGASLRGNGGVRYIYYLQDDTKQLVETTHGDVRADRTFTILEDVNCPAVLVEQCFVTNPEDVARFGDADGCRRAARAYYEAICAYFGTEPLNR